MMKLLLVAIVACMASVQGCSDEIKYDKVYDFRRKISVEPILQTRGKRAVLLQKVSAAPYGVTQHVPFSYNGCSTRGVLKIALATAGIQGRRVLVDMFFNSNPTGFNFNLGGSPTNNGYAGDSSTTIHDAEIHSSKGQNVLGYKADTAGSGLAFNYPQFFTNRLTLVIGHNNIVFARNVDINYYDLPGMFDLDANNNLYLGINRVIYGGRTGTGVCKVGIKFLDKLQ